MTRIFKTLVGGIIILLAWSFTNPLFAQAREIRGRVTASDNNQPLQGVTVTVKGTKTATVTDADGNFRISANNSATLVFTSVGYQTFESAVGDKTVINASLTPEVKSGDEVVVIGYQSIKRKDLLASVSSVSAKELKDVPVNSAAEALNGRLAGVTATTAEGSPDAQITIRVRGGMSINNDNSPLYIIDGVQMENALSVISPQDIQSIDVLKDASATAIYGARGANGVIIITTKSGRIGKAKVSYNFFIGVKNLPKTLKVLDPYDFVFYQSERSRGSSTDSANFITNFGPWNQLSQYKNTAPVNWQDEVFGNTGITRQHNVTLSGGTKKITYNFGYTYNDDKAIVINSAYRRNILNFKGEYRITDKFKVGISPRYVYQNVYGAGVSDTKGSSYNRLRNAVKYRPFLSNGQDIIDVDPTADPNPGNGLGLVNPLRLASAEYRRKTTEDFDFSAYATYTITKNLTFKSTFGYDHNKLTDRQFSDSLTPYSIIQGGAKPIAGLDTTVSTTITNSNVLTYSVNNYKNKHSFTVLVGQETYDLKTDLHSSLFKNYPTFTPYNAAFVKTGLGVPFTGYPKHNQTRYTNLSFFGRVSYAYKDKYLATFNLRADGASKFAPDHQWGYFSSGSVAWRVKNEKFMENVNFISDLKLRVGYGQAGNDRIKDYLFLPTFSSDGKYYYGLNNQAVIAYYPVSLPNAILQWESTLNHNYGLDISLFKGRLDLSVDVYNNISSKLLLDVPLDVTFGTPIIAPNTVPTQVQNIGKTSNKGVEVQLNGIVMRKQSFSWSANFNISFNKNRIVALGPNQLFYYPTASWGVSGQPTDYIEKIGYPIGSMYGLVADGFYSVDDFNYNSATGAYTLKPGVVSDLGIIGPVQPGSIKFKDLNNDGVIDLDHDRTIIGNPTPKFTGGFNQQFTYKNWDASIFVNFSYGNDVYNANKIEFTNGYINNSNMLAIMADRWRVVTPDGQTAQFVVGSGNAGVVYGIPPDQLKALNAGAKIWQPLKGAGAFYPSSWAIENGSFLRFNNVTIGYTLPVKAVSALKMERIRFYVTANNLAIITNYTGYDPEVSVRSSSLTPGLDYSAYPKSRSFIFGINATFK
ncbi:MAG: TonB-dependent receptor [Bacteroidota bacterium]|nr:TonB-dependent receptor [Bacteroidota bacterium]